MSGDFTKLAVAHIFVGYELGVLGMWASGGANDERAMFIIGFLCYTVTVILLACMQLGVIGNGLPEMISSIVLVLIAGLFFIVGVGLWGSRTKNNINPYTATLDSTSALLAIIGGIFLILVVAKCGGGGGKTGPK